MDVKKWSIALGISYLAIVILIGTVVIVVDPYFHYHAPVGGLAYKLENQQYINDGITKNFDYNGIITGSSTSLGFSIEEAGELFQKDFVRLSYLGESFKRIGDNIKVAICENQNLDMVIWGLDTMWFISDANNMGYEEYPEYLYDENIFNDTRYLFNGEILVNDVLPEIGRTIQGKKADSFDNYGYLKTQGAETVLNVYQRPEKEDLSFDPAQNESDMNRLRNNLDQNVLSIVEANPGVTFYIFFPPYSICWWDSLHQGGDERLLRRIEMEKIAIECLTEYENVRIFSFFNNFDLICNLDNYIDEIHYIKNVNSQIMIWMQEGSYELTKENYEKYIEEITDFYINYNYDDIFN